MRVLADWSITRPGLFLYHASRRHFPAALRAFIDCMLDKDLTARKRGGAGKVAPKGFSRSGRFSDVIG